MIEGWAIIALALAYVSGLFALAWYADRTFRARKGGSGRPLVYSLSIAVYCTSWTFFGSVGFAATTGYDFMAVYLGPILLFALGWRLLLRIVRVAKSQNITSIADFLAAIEVMFWLLATRTMRSSRRQPSANRRIGPR